jgi:CysZ protein
MHLNPLSGALCLVQGVPLLQRPVLRPFVLGPLLVSALIFGAGSWWLYGRFQELMLWIEGFLPVWLMGWIGFLLLPVFLVAVLMVVSMGFSVVANLASAPVNDMLAERMEQVLLVKPLPSLESSWSELVRSAPAAFAHEVRKILVLLFWLLLIGALWFVPVINLAVPFLWAGVSSWLLTAEYLDYPMGNNNLSSSQVRRAMRREPVLTFSFGFAAMLVAMLPVVNMVSVPVTVAGATLLWVRYLRPAEMESTASDARG